MPPVRGLIPNFTEQIHQDKDKCKDNYRHPQFAIIVHDFQSSLAFPLALPLQPLRLLQHLVLLHPEEKLAVWQVLQTFNLHLRFLSDAHRQIAIVGHT